MYVHGMVQREDGVERQRAVFQPIMDRTVFLRVPCVVYRNDHLDSAATEVPSAFKHVSRILAHNQGADIREAKDLVERERSEVRCSRRIGQVQWRRACKRSRVQKSVRRGLVKRFTNPPRPSRVTLA